MSETIVETTNVRKAAIIISALGEELAAEVCASLPVTQVLALGEEISRLRHVTASEFNEILDEFVSLAGSSANLGGVAYARSLLDSTLGAAQTASLQEADPDGLVILARLNELEPAVLWRVLRAENRQTIAAILSHLTASNAAQLLTNMDGETAADIAYRAAHLTSPSPGAMQALAATLDMELRAAHSRLGSTPDISLQFVVDLIGSMPPARGKQMLEALHGVDKEFGEGVAEQVFTFDDIITLSDTDLQVLLRQLEMGVLVLALKGTPPELRERAKQNLSQRGRERLDEEMEMLGPVPLSQVQDAQRQVCHQARALAEAGEIGLDSGSTEYVT